MNHKWTAELHISIWLHNRVDDDFDNFAIDVKHSSTITFCAILITFNYEHRRKSTANYKIYARTIANWSSPTHLTAYLTVSFDKAATETVKNNGCEQWWWKSFKNKQKPWFNPISRSERGSIADGHSIFAPTILKSSNFQKRPSIKKEIFIGVKGLNGEHNFSPAIATMCMWWFVMKAFRFKTRFRKLTRFVLRWCRLS